MRSEISALGVKTNKILVAGLATTLILSLGITSSYAYGGNGGGYGKGQGQGIHQGQGQEKGQGSHQSGHEHSPVDLLEGVELQELNDEEKEMLYYGYSEELLAHDMYMYFYDLYGVQTFKNIANSESKHMEAVKVLLERYELEIPTDYGELTDEFDALKSEGEESLQKALEVGVKIEMLDIDDIAETIRTTDNDDFRIIFTNIGGASYNHLRGFLNGLKNNGLETEIDYSDYLTEDEVNTKGGALKSKIAEKMQAEGVDLPEQATPEYIKEKCDKKQSNKVKGQKRSEQVNKGKQGQYNSNVKNQYKVKYRAVISKMSDDKLNTLIGKIDTLSDKINAGNYSGSTKQKYNSILSALRELAVENLDENEINIDELFE